jgi:pilus assembly protein CpaB
MNSKAMTLSLIMAGIAVFFVTSSVTSIEEEAKKKFGDEITVLVAKADINEMDTILDGMIEPRSVPRRFVEPSAVAFNTLVKEDSNDYAMEVKRIIGNVAIVPIKKGEQLSLNKITEPNMRTGLAPQVAPGKRAISITAGELESVGKLVKPGDRVDVIVVLNTQVAPGNDSTNGKVAKTFMQDAVILAVGRNITNNIARKIESDGSSGKTRIKSLNDFDGYASVTLEVDPAQAQALAVVMADPMNKIYLTLRNNDDTDRTNLGGIRKNDLINNEIRMPASQPTGNR